MKLLFATQNKNKVKEIQNQLNGSFDLIGLTDLDYFEDLEETHDTLKGNALQKANFVYNKFNLNCFADDTSLEIEALNGEPGVKSARYAGETKSFDANMNKVLDRLADKESRSAQFRTVIALVYNGEKHLFEGVCKGEIIKEKIGAEGFGYDPIFRPDGYQETFAQMNMALKNEISHRGIAVKKLINFLNTLPKS